MGLLVCSDTIVPLQANKRLQSHSGLATSQSRSGLVMSGCHLNETSQSRSGMVTSGYDLNATSQSHSGLLMSGRNLKIK